MLCLSVYVIPQVTEYKDQEAFNYVYIHQYQAELVKIILMQVKQLHNNVFIVLQIPL